MNEVIDISNYEAYVMDYMEKKLDAQLHAQFETFLLIHPEIAMEIEEMEAADLCLEAPIIAFDSEALKVKLTSIDGLDESNYEKAFALAVDADINPKLTQQVEHFVSVNPQLKQDQQLFSKTRLIADTTLVFPYKADLKQPVPMWSFVSPAVLRVAAAILILFGIFGVLSTIQDEVYKPRQFASNLESLEWEAAPKTIASIAPTAPELMFTTDQPRKIKKANIVLPQLQNHWQAPEHLEARNDEMIVAVMPKSKPKSTPQVRPEAQSEINLAQYLGKSLLGVNPDDATTTRALIEQSAMKVLPNNDQFAVNSSNKTDNKKTFKIKAAGIEFKRVTYNAN